MRNNNIYGKSIPTKTTHWIWSLLGNAIAIALMAWLGVWIAERIVG